MIPKHITAIAFLAAFCLAVVSPLQADWLETNADGSPSGGLDYLPYWVAAWNGSSPNPATDWYTASYLSTWYGTDPGWTGWVVNITDADATAYAAANQVESFTDHELTYFRIFHRFRAHMGPEPVSGNPDTGGSDFAHRHGTVLFFQRNVSFLFFDEDCFMRKSAACKSCPDCSERSRFDKITPSHFLSL